VKRPATLDAEALATAVRAEIQSTSEGRYYHRLHVALLVLSGHSCQQAARLYNMSTRTVQHWMAQLAWRGLGALRETARPGRPPKLSESDKDALVKDLAASPRALGYHQDHWDARVLLHHLDTTYGVRLGIRQCQRLIRLQALTLLRAKSESLDPGPA